MVLGRILAALWLPMAATGALGAAKTQSGDYRMMLGAIEITALSDGTVDLKLADRLTQTTPTRVVRACQSS